MVSLGMQIAVGLVEHAVSVYEFSTSQPFFQEFIWTVNMAGKPEKLANEKVFEFAASRIILVNNLIAKSIILNNKTLVNQKIHAGMIFQATEGMFLDLKGSLDDNDYFVSNTMSSMLIMRANKNK